MKKRTTNPHIEVKGLTFSYGSSPLLEKIDLTIYRGEFIAIIGPNGGGKTTFLKLLLGLLKPSKGSITTFSEAGGCSQCQVAYVPQAMHFDKQFPISLKELVLMGLLHETSWMGRYSKEQEERAFCAIEKVGLKGLENRPFGALSGGEAQRALFARALVTNPKLLFLDEPTTNIDPFAGEMIRTLIHEMVGKTTVIMVTHDIEEITPKVDRVLCIYNGLTILEPKEVCNHYKSGLYHRPISLGDKIK